MPLKKGSSKKTILQNAKEMMAAGHPKDQSWAAAFSSARRSKLAKPRRRKLNARRSH